MKIEAYLFVPYRGQSRFSFDLFDNNHCTEFTTSNKAYDYVWDLRMRQRPTLKELVDEDRVEQRAEFEKSIREAFKSVQDRVVNSLNSRIKKDLPGVCRIQKDLAAGYVEFVRIV